MRVSFVVPTWNRADFLGRCLESCLSQGLEDAEVIVIDGASTDGTVEILKSYGDRIRWLSERDEGQADAVNKGIAMASGDLIAWVNSDDSYASPDALREVVGEFDDDVDIVVGDGVMVDVAGEPIRPYPASRCSTVREILLHPASPFLQPAVFFRKSLFLAAGGLDQRLHFTLDYDLWLRMFPLARRVARLPTILARAIYHADAKSIQGMRLQIQELVALKRRHAAHLALGPADMLRLWLGVASLWAYWAAVKAGLKRAT